MVKAERSTFNLQHACKAVQNCHKEVVPKTKETPDIFNFRNYISYLCRIMGIMQIYLLFIPLLANSKDFWYSNPAY